MRLENLSGLSILIAESCKGRFLMAHSIIILLHQSRNIVADRKDSVLEFGILGL